MSDELAVPVDDEEVDSDLLEQEEEKNYVVVGGQEFDLSRPSPKAITGIARMLAKMQLRTKNDLANIKSATNLDLVMAFIANLSDDDLVNVGALCIGADKKFVEQNFDLDWLSEALAITVRNSNIVKVIRNFTSMFSQAAG
jgi:hypothetical protein